jgi:phospholipid/cholesterol/gamma-HCH transport system substrate-binding protein
METRANFALIGAFTLAVVFGAFSFVFWFSGSGKTAQYQTYELIVRGSVDGLTPGSVVQFNGLKVGSVTSMEIDPEDPGQVKVLIAVDKKTPVKTNTRARVEQKTFTGVAAVSLVGGTPGAPDIVAQPGEKYPRIAAERSEIQNLLENVQRLSNKAGDVMDKIDKLLDENSPSLTASLKNVESFTKTLADNSGPTGNFIRDAADVAHSLKPVAERFDKLLASAERTVKALDPKTIKSITGNVAGISSNFNRFSETGLRQYEQLAIDARKAVDTLDRAVRSFERDPSQVIFGPSQTIPEVRGQ